VSPEVADTGIGRNSAVAAGSFDPFHDERRARNRVLVAARASATSRENAADVSTGLGPNRAASRAECLA
jgi:hypothetical protein